MLPLNNRLLFGRIFALARVGEFRNLSLSNPRLDWRDLPRMKWRSGPGNQMPVSFRLGHPDDPERWTTDQAYYGQAEWGDKVHDSEWFYRTDTGKPFVLERVVHTLLGGLVWGWFWYHLYWYSEMMFGHFYIPYTYEFSDEELGIPPDDAPDPASDQYWGNHGKPRGTYR